LKILVIACGGAMGALLRYFSSTYISNRSSATFPYGTLFVNLAGSFIIGALWGISEERVISIRAREFLFVGVLGAFTTFSTYSLETVNLLRLNEVKLAFANILVSNVSGILFAFTGYLVSKQVLKII
jgi:fluoride exporter